MNMPGHDIWKWKLRGPDDVAQPYIGSKHGDTCNRYPEPDEDQPRGYRPRPCGGLMMESNGVAVCESCGATA